MLKDKLTICTRCGSDACYEQTSGIDYTIKLCYGCGFTTNTLMHTGSKFLQEQVEVLPELYKDLMYTDLRGLKWVPSSVSDPKKGMIFADGKNNKEWKWAAVKSSPSKQNSHKMDMANLKHFDERDYMEALEYIGVFEKDIKE